MLALRSVDLELTASSIEQAARRLAATSTEQQAHWSDVATLTDASSFEMGFNRLDSYVYDLSHLSSQMLDVARTVLATSDVVKTLEGYIAYLENLADRSITITVMLNYLSSIGQLLDLLCAREIDALCVALTPAPLRHLSDFTGLPSTAIHEYHLINAPPAIQVLTAANPDMQILESGDGTLVAAFGDIDTASTATTIVAGVGSSDPSSWQSNLDRARTVHTTTGSATVLWLGYQAPQSIPLAVSGQAASRAAPDLQRFQASLKARTPSQSQVVVGYSYGSTVVGHAARGGELDADAIVLVGSPGAGSGIVHASQLGTPVYSVTGHADPIGFSATDLGGIHGADPTSRSFGATVWDSGSDHSGYWEDPQFLANLETVVKSVQK
ncbi:hypothetical protein CDES_12540 [Corynebacterium deserti GIMN1.010]|uniref:DUF1023 domain-containing protein n=1 Tax=Corynebacterium deserti GIMN1.010 TaxID=931089 RepID=A0A0M4CHX5_9CORY|nr:alpha/beta hydrolase [Corynebacterium deserti]ALC06852.1 hypothetical protein CDES_12540 [Corynebacterium deserti GIMN1.010]